MKILFAEFTARSGYESQVAALVSGFTDDVRREPGNISFDPYTLSANEREYIVFESYRDDVAFQEHLDSPHSKRFNTELTDLVEGKASILTWLTAVA